MSEEENKLKLIASLDHPHHGEVGWIDHSTLQPATGQYYFKLSNCGHGMYGCYVHENELTEPEAGIAKPEENPTNPTPFDPYKYSEATHKKLVEAFSQSFNVSEACQYAGIHRDTFYQWCKDIEGFEVAMDEAKAAPLKLAKGVIHGALRSGDVTTAKWYAERRDPDFKPKAEIDNNIGIQETRKKIGDFLDDDDGTNDVGEQPTAADSSTVRGEVAQAPTDIS